MKFGPDGYPIDNPVWDTAVAKQLAKHTPLGLQYAQNVARLFRDADNLVETNGKPTEKQLLTIERDTQYVWHESETSFKSSRSGVGNGEDLLLEMIGGQLMGYTASWDVTDAAGRKWEVKEPTGGMIRLCTSGREASGRVMSVVEQTVNQLVMAHTMYGEDLQLLLIDGITFDFDEFIEDDTSLLLRGEIPPVRYYRLLQVLEALAKHANSNKQFHHVSLDGISKKIDAVTFAKIVDLVGADDVYVDAKSGVLAKLQHPAFRNSTILQDAWDSVTAESVFPDVDGVILVNSYGFRPIFRDQFNEQLQFNRISQMVPKFKYTGPELITDVKTRTKRRSLAYN